MTLPTQADGSRTELAGAGPQAPFRTPPEGLSAADVAARVASGDTNEVAVKAGRSVWKIIRLNVFTFFNGLLFTLFVIILATGQWQNALFGGVILANSAIGIIQELRA